MPEEFGRYRLVELIGRGGMGEVYRAHDMIRDRTVALKLLPGYLAGDEAFESRFRRESRLAARLNEPHIIPIHDFGEIDGRLFLDMRLVEGHDLATVLELQRSLPPEIAVEVIAQMASALDAAHGSGLVHRDVKPSNILLTGMRRDAPLTASDAVPFAYLVDFGIARSSTPGGTALTATSATVGTISYMSPERISGSQTDLRSDVYALACVLYETLTGAKPYEGELFAQMYAHLHGDIPAVSATAPDVPRALDDVVATGMAKSPDDRYGSAGQLARAARAALQAQPTVRPAEQSEDGTDARTTLPMRGERAAPEQFRGAGNTAAPERDDQRRPGSRSAPGAAVAGAAGAGAAVAGAAGAGAAVAGAGAADAGAAVAGAAGAGAARPAAADAGAAGPVAADAGAAARPGATATPPDSRARSAAPVPPAPPPGATATPPDPRARSAAPVPPSAPPGIAPPPSSPASGPETRRGPATGLPAANRPPRVASAAAAPAPPPPPPPATIRPTRPPPPPGQPAVPPPGQPVAPPPGQPVAPPPGQPVAPPPGQPAVPPPFLPGLPPGATPPGGTALSGPPGGTGRGRSRRIALIAAAVVVVVAIGAVAAVFLTRGKGNSASPGPSGSRSASSSHSRSASASGSSAGGLTLPTGTPGAGTVSWSHFASFTKLVGTHNRDTRHAFGRGTCKLTGPGSEDAAEGVADEVVCSLPHSTAKVAVARFGSASQVQSYLHQHIDSEGYRDLIWTTDATARGQTLVSSPNGSGAAVITSSICALPTYLVQVGAPDRTKVDTQMLHDDIWNRATFPDRTPPRCDSSFTAAQSGDPVTPNAGPAKSVLPMTPSVVRTLVQRGDSSLPVVQVSAKRGSDVIGVGQKGTVTFWTELDDTLQRVGSSTYPYAPSSLGAPNASATGALLSGMKDATFIVRGTFSEDGSGNAVAYTNGSKGWGAIKAQSSGNLGVTDKGVAISGIGLSDDFGFSKGRLKTVDCSDQLPVAQCSGSNRVIKYWKWDGTEFLEAGHAGLSH